MMLGSHLDNLNKNFSKVTFVEQCTFSDNIYVLLIAIIRQSINWRIKIDQC